MNSDLGHSAASASEASTTPLSALPDRLGEIALRIAKDESYRHRAAEALLAIATDLRDRELPQDAALKAIGDLAHDKSTGPAVPDTLWEIRGIAYEALGAPLVVEAEPATTRRITPDAPASPAPPQGEREAFEAHWLELWGEELERVGTHYASNVACTAWDAWQARASLSASTPSAVSAEARDAARYRWLMKRSFVQEVYADPDNYFELGFPEVRISGYGADKGAAIDAAMAPPADKENGK